MKKVSIAALAVATLAATPAIGLCGHSHHRHGGNDALAIAGATLFGAAVIGTAAAGYPYYSRSYAPPPPAYGYYGYEAYGADPYYQPQRTCSFEVPIHNRYGNVVRWATRYRPC